MNLLDFPPEILQVILKQCVTSSFIEATLSCRTLFSIGSTCREVVVHHLHQTAGLPREIDYTKSTDNLFKELREKTAIELYGAEFHSDLTLYTLDEGTIDPRASSIRLVKSDLPISAPILLPNAALVCKSGKRVYLYDIGGENSKQLLDILETPYEYPGKVEILQTVLPRTNINDPIAVLQRYEPDNTTGNSNSQSFVGEAMKPFFDAGVHLVHYEYEESTRRYSKVTISVFPDFDINYAPVAIDVANMDLVAVSWQHVQFPERKRVVLYNFSMRVPIFRNDIQYFEYDASILMDERGGCPNLVPRLPPPGQRHVPRHNSGQSPTVMQLIFNDRNSQILYYDPSSTVHGRFQLLELEPTPNVRPGIIMRNYSFTNLPIPNRSPARIGFQIDIPFFSTHSSYTENGTAMCHWQYLAVGVAQQPNQEWGAFILRSEARCRSFRCNHMPNLDRGRRLDDWTALAKLDGYKEPSSSIRSTFISSDDGTLLGLADWKGVYIWALNPQKIIEGNANEYYPPSMLWGDDVQDDDGARDSPPVVLSPIALQLDAVCFSIRFTLKNKKLIALTDKGLMEWTLDSRGGGTRLKNVLSPELEVDELRSFLACGNLPEASDDESEIDDA